MFFHELHELDEGLRQEKTESNTIDAFENDNKDNLTENRIDLGSKKFNVEGKRIEFREIYHEIFDRNETEFEFKEFDFGSKELKECLIEFKEENWSKLDEIDKIKVVEEYKQCLEKMLELKKIPKLVWFSADKNNCGCFVGKKNTIYININWINEPEMTLDTLSHEMWHAKQYERSKRPKERNDYLYAVNFSPKVYYTPQKVGKNYVGYDLYEGQLVEAEARAFASRIVEGVEENGRN